MMKNFFIGIAAFLVFLAALTVLAANIIQQKAPEYLRNAIERSLNKEVIIRDVEYRFPRTFELQGFEIREKDGLFKGESSFYVDEVTLDLSPMIFSQKALTIDHLEVDGAQIVIRKFHGKLFHALSGVRGAARPQNGTGKTSAATAGSQKISGVNLPLEIHSFELKNGHFKFADYDVKADGFVMTFDKIDADIKNISVPSMERKTSYQIHCQLLQERDQRRAQVHVSGWTVFDTLDTDATFSMEGVHLPYFEPYYGQVTGAALEDGFADLRAGVKMSRGILDLSMGFELSGLLFESYESGDELFGLKADQVLSFLKDSSGRLKFQILVNWNTADKSVKLREVFRRSIERSLRETVIGNVGNILMNVLQKVNDAADGPGKKSGVEEKIKKIKDFFKY